MAEEMTAVDLEARKAAFVRRLNSNIKESGFSVVAIFPTGDEPEPTPGFAYTVGMWETWKQPELLSVGLPREVAHSIYWDIARRIEAGGDGARYRDGDVADGLLEGGYKVAFRAIAPPHHPLAFARRHYGKARFEAVQMVYPDEQHRFPWDDGYDLDPRLQPLASGDGKEGL